MSFSIESQSTSSLYSRRSTLGSEVRGPWVGAAELGLFLLLGFISFHLKINYEDEQRVAAVANRSTSRGGGWGGVGRMRGTGGEKRWE